MPSSDDLQGLGMPSPLAQVLGNQPATLTCTGTTQATAALIKTTNTELVAAGSATGAILNSSAPNGSPYYLFTSSSTAALIYPPVGEVLNGTTNGTLSLAQNKAAIIWQYKNNNWVSILTA